MKGLVGHERSLCFHLHYSSMLKSTAKAVFHWKTFIHHVKHIFEISFEVRNVPLSSIVRKENNLKIKDTYASKNNYGTLLKV